MNSHSSYIWHIINWFTYYKVALLTLKIRCFAQPHYLAPFVKSEVSVLNLWSSGTEVFEATNAHFAKTNVCHSSFNHAGPAIWNSLPKTLRKSNSTLAQRTFAKKLKVHLFSLTYQTCAYISPLRIWHTSCKKFLLAYLSSLLWPAKHCKHACWSKFDNRATNGVKGVDSKRFPTLS